MCGIAGILTDDKEQLPHQLHAATDTLVHRGPEQQAFYYNHGNTLGLGHRRLCIIDLSEEAAQPFRYNNRYIIVYNGELYNYLELKQQLVSKGFSFRTTSDTEVVIAAYAAFGKDCLTLFDGMFAFTIWDEQEQYLFAARDRMGEKPFYYYRQDATFAFASEMKALWAMGVAKEVNSAMLYNFLTIGYTGNPSDTQETFYQGIHKLPAASFLTYKVQSNELAIERYWFPAIEINHTITEQAAIETFRHLFSNSIQMRLRSDVAIGTSLSGGLDSSAIVAGCHPQQTAAYTHKCFTAVFEGFERNEEEQAARVANEFGLEHHLVRIKEDELTALMGKLMQYQEEPFSSASPIAQYKVYEAAKQNGVTVLLDGQGADELLAGYSRYYKWYWQELYRNKTLQTELKAAKELGINESFDWRARLAARFPQFTGALWEGRKSKQANRHKDLNRDFAFAHKQQFYYTLPATPDLNGALYYNSFVNGLEELLRLADRNSMAHSVEVRLPFLSHELVEFLFTLPASFKIKNGWTKWLLRKAMEPNLPKEIVWRKDKVGFEPPQKQWMKNKQVQEAMMEARRKLVTQGILEPSVLSRPIIEKEAHAANSNEWRYWSASYLFS